LPVPTTSRVDRHQLEEDEVSKGPFPRIATLATAVPDLIIDQTETFEKVFRHLFVDVPSARSIFQNAGIRKRHWFCDPAGWSAGGADLMGARMRLWKEGAVELGRRAVGGALEGIDRSSIGSMVTASCTGYDAPSPDMLLAAEFGLSDRLRRTFIGHMGCYAAFNAIKVALDALAARPDEAVLVNCTEICSAHMRTEATVEQVVCHALFGDASAACVLTTSEAASGPQILHTHTETLYHTSDKMSWTVLDDGFRMHLSPRVPLILRDAATGFVERMLAPLGMTADDIDHWSIHAGGPKIIQAVVHALGLRDEQYRASTEVLAEFGNCSSPTSLLILHRLLNHHPPKPGSTGVMMAFGPGLTMESIVLRY
jgi:predicted naringenin-chalcone synthase